MREHKEEVWKDIPGYENLYQASTHGRIKSLPKEWNCGNNTKRKHSGKILSQSINSTKYFNVRIKDKFYLTHRLIALTFILNPENRPEVNHKDGNKLNNCVDNLEWNTRIENQRHAIKNELVIGLKGVKNGRVKLNEAQVLEIRERYKLGEKNYSNLALDYNVSSSAIKWIIIRKNWKHI